jgi:Uma2 family endonuclease
MSVSMPNFLTYEQFIAVAESIKDNTGHVTEYSNGRIYYFSPNARHGKSIRNLCNILEFKLPSSCVVANELHIKFAENEYRIPDVSVFCGKDMKDKYENDLLHLEIPKLVFEVLSESTEENDRGYKMELYAKKDIEEYAIVDYRNKIIEQYYLQDNSYKLNKKYMNDDVCSLLLYPHVKFITSDIFKLFMQG